METSRMGGFLEFWFCKHFGVLKQDARRYSTRFPVMDSLDLPRLIFPAQKLSNLRRPAKLVDDVM